jgi:MFS transporter, DHA2 family, multidrug resistance protein
MAKTQEIVSVNRKLVTISVMLATVMQALDSTIANVALPRMQGSFAATQDQMIWVLTSYIVAAAITIPLTGWLSGRYGRKPVFLISIVGFTISSALCGAAESLFQIVLFRLSQGICGAALVPLSQALLLDINPPEKLGRAMALWGVGVTMGPILGPLLGGWLTDNYNWRWVFYINVPIGILAFLGLSLSMPDTERKEDSFDFFGFITLSLGVGALQVFLDRGTLKDWFGSQEIILQSIVCGIGFYLFLIHTLTYKKPFIDPRLFADRNFVVCNIFIFIVGIVLFATLALLPPMLQDLMNYPVSTTGIVTAPRGVGSMISMMLVSRLMERVDARLIIAAGFSLTVLSLWQMTHYSLLMDEWPIITSGIVQGLGIGLCYVPLSSLAFATLPAQLRNEGTSFFNLIRNIGSSIGISFVQALLTHNTQVLHSTMSSHITSTTTTNPALTLNQLDTSNLTGLLKLDALITKQATMIAYINDFYIMMVMTVIVTPFLLLLRRPKQVAAPKSMAAIE